MPFCANCQGAVAIPGCRGLEFRAFRAGQRHRLELSPEYPFKPANPGTYENIMSLVLHSPSAVPGPLCSAKHIATLTAART